MTRYATQFRLVAQGLVDYVAGIVHSAVGLQRGFVKLWRDRDRLVVDMSLARTSSTEQQCFTLYQTEGDYPVCAVVSSRTLAAGPDRPSCWEPSSSPPAAWWPGNTPPPERPMRRPRVSPSPSSR